MFLNPARYIKYIPSYRQQKFIESGLTHGGYYNTLILISCFSMKKAVLLKQYGYVLTCRIYPQCAETPEEKKSVFYALKINGRNINYRNDKFSDLYDCVTLLNV